MIRQSNQDIPVDDQRDEYLGSFLNASYIEDVEEVVDMPILDKNASYVANSRPDSVLASIIEPERPKEYALVTPPIKKSCILDNQCVHFVEGLMDRKFNANAKNIPVNEDQPCEKCAVVTYGGPYGHIAFITKVESPSFEVVEQNRIGCGIVSTRSINFEEQNNIKGYVK